MEATSEAKIPLLHYSSATGGDERRKLLGAKILEACETYGCFLLTCVDVDDGETAVSSGHRNRMLESLKTLFDLPEETKLKHQNPKPYGGYTFEIPHVPHLHESFGGIDDASSPETARMFTDLLWPRGNPDFCETFHYMSKKMEELNFEVMRMIGESFGLEKRHSERLIENSTSVLRLMKYKPPCQSAGDGDFELGLVPHTDMSSLTVLSQNDVQGLQIVTPLGEWARVVVPHNAFLFFAGDALKAWSNGRLVAAKHRVVMSGERDRYSFGLFAMPKDEAVIQVPEELVDGEHPLRYRSFKFSDYFSYFASNRLDDALELFAGV